MDDTFFTDTLSQWIHKRFIERGTRVVLPNTAVIRDKIRRCGSSLFCSFDVTFCPADDSALFRATEKVEKDLLIAKTPRFNGNQMEYLNGWTLSSAFIVLQCVAYNE